MNNKIVERFLREYIRPQFRQVVAIFICTALSSLCTVATAKFVKPIIDDVFVSKNVSMLGTIAFYFFAISLRLSLSNARGLLGVTVTTDLQRGAIFCTYPLQKHPYAQ